MDPVVCTPAALGAAIGLCPDRTRRWLRRVGAYDYVGSGARLHLTAADVRAVAVGCAVAGSGYGGHPERYIEVHRRAVHAAIAAAEHPQAGYVVASTESAAAFDTAEEAISAWQSAGRPVVAFVPLRAVLQPVEHLLRLVAA